MTLPIEQAKALLQSVPFTKDLADYVVGYPDYDESYWTASTVASSLARSLCYQVAIDGLWLPDHSDLGLGSSFGRERVQIVDEDAIPLGTSKYRGLPHLPPDMPWPDGLYFGAQLDLARLAQLDTSDRLPKEGMLYLFYNGNLEAKVIHWRGPVEQLERRAYPELSTLPDADHYYERFRVGEQIRFNPHWLLICRESELYDHSGIRGLLPAALVDAVSKALGAPLASFDCIRRLYGRRFDYQDEFESRGHLLLDESLLDADDETFFAVHERPIDDEEDDWMVLFHDDFGDAAVHFRCAPEAAARGDFSKIDVTASCT